MKLDVKRTLLVGLAFMSISMFSQLYDLEIPKILVNEFGIPEFYKGIIMAIDNILALFMLPLFGTLSDKVQTKIGRRMPFILFGTIGAALSLILIPISIALSSFVMFFISVMVILLLMATYRSPAVALMPDVTPKPLRSKGNSIINLTGAIGGIITLVLILFLVKDGGSYFPIFIVVALLMIICAIILYSTVDENKLVENCKNESLKLGEKEETLEVTETPLLPAERRSMVFILISITLWFMAYNAVMTGYSLYAELELGLVGGTFVTPLIIAQAAAIFMFIPIGIVGSKIGRKKTILIGILTLTIAFTLPIFTTSKTAFLLTPAFILAGFGWAAINVNSLPMVLEMSTGKTVGKFTGIYYTFSMTAQIITPVLSGYLIGLFGEINNKFTSSGTYADYSILFPYAVFFLVIALFTMLLVKHGDSIPKKKKVTTENELS